MSEKYHFHLDRDEREAIARGDARMRGWDPAVIREKHDGAWEGCLMRAEQALLTAQYIDQCLHHRLGLNTSPQTP